ncbi:MAG TPA: hypothetical protein VNG33_13980, partial [Polyangiaceae bacterium]|nr:hypothetical protein [Polyangiaceae bacterium]
MGRSSHFISALVYSALGVFLCVGCGNSSGSTDNSAQATAGAGGSGGTSSAGVNSAGSSAAGDHSGGSNSGGSNSGGGGAGGNHSSGAGGSMSGCDSVADCPATPLSVGITHCLWPGESPPSSGCGAPQWCGQCSCPPMPRAPAGTGMQCTTNADCPAATPGLSTAGVCAAGSCTQCATNTDCPTEAPICSSVQVALFPGAAPGTTPTFHVCVACQTDTDCPGAKPHCSLEGGTAACVACTSTIGCAQGVCASGACVPGCGPAQPCSSPLQECGALQRCQALSCASSASCPPNTDCAAGHCGRRTCTADAQCDQGACVKGICYETRGTCYVQMLAQ